jgi:hypothetical protein
MLYNVYKHCNEEDFDKFKSELTLLKEKILASLPGELENQVGYEESDYLVIHFRIIDSTFKGSLGIDFDDLPEEKSFSVKIIKTFDVDRKRYFKKKTAIQCSLDEIEIHYASFINTALGEYSSWSMNDLLSGEFVDLEF